MTSFFLFWRLVNVFDLFPLENNHCDTNCPENASNAFTSIPLHDIHWYCKIPCIICRNRYWDTATLFFGFCLIIKALVVICTNNIDPNCTREIWFVVLFVSTDLHYNVAYTKFSTIMLQFITVFVYYYLILESNVHIIIDVLYIHV